MPGTRRTHTKSRGGCSECKRRKIKCGEERPECQGCQKRAVPCEYPSESSPSTRIVPVPILQSDGYLPYNPPPGSNVSPHTPLVYTPNFIPGHHPHFARRTCHFDMDDMAIWHQFITETAITISPAWERELPRLALTCDYLMHGILATGALHLAYLHPVQREKYEMLANQHQDLALMPFQHATSNITADNCNHIFGFSTLLMVFNYSSFRNPEDLLPFSGGESYGGLANWIVCLRGCASIYQQAKTHIENGPLGFLVSQQSISAIENAGRIECPPDDDDKSLEYLTKHLLTSPMIEASTTNEEMDAYTDAINRLRKLLVGCSQINDMGFKKMMASIWPSSVSETYLRLLSEQQPLALIIMAHYCLLIQKCHSCWYMSTRALDMFEAIRRSRGPDWFLSEEWFPYIEHPLRVFNART